MTNAQEIPWKRLSVEAAAIVISILLAFAIDAWWDERQERTFEREVLLGLRAEYQDHRDVLASQKSGQLRSLRGIAGLLVACERGFWESDEFSVDNAIFSLQLTITSDLGSGVRDSLISAGRIDIISDKQLRYQLSEWDSVLDELTDSQIFDRNNVRSLILPYLTERGVALSEGASFGIRTSWPAATRLISTDADAMASLFADPEFHSIVEFRYGHMAHTSDEFDDVQTAIDAILERIEMSLAY